MTESDTRCVNFGDNNYHYIYIYIYCNMMDGHEVAV